MLMAAPMMAWGQVSLLPNPAANHPAITSPISDHGDRGYVKNDSDSCTVRQVKSLPGSHAFAADFIEVMATDPSPAARNRNVVWGLTADLSGWVPAKDRALYISKSTNGGKTWTQVAQLDSRYFDSGIDEGLRNGLAVSPGGTEFVVTTQKGAFQVIPQPHRSDAVVKPEVVNYIEGPRVHLNPSVSIPKREGDPVRAAAVKMTADGKKLIVGYGYFDGAPQLFAYHKGRDGALRDRAWVEDGPLPQLPTDLDIFSMEFDRPRDPRPGSLYVGTGDQVYRLDLRTMKWIEIEGVEPDSAIHGINTVGGLHLAACWGVYVPVGPDRVGRLTNAEFIYHRDDDETGPNVRAYGIEIDPARPSRQVVTALTGVYISRDSGGSWKRLNELPEGEYRSAHFNADGTVIISGLPGTFLANPFSTGCLPRLKRREEWVP
jgi:hypothetical protein